MGKRFASLGSFAEKYYHVRGLDSLLIMHQYIFLADMLWAYLGLILPFLFSRRLNDEIWRPNDVLLNQVFKKAKSLRLVGYVKLKAHGGRANYSFRDW